MRFTRSRVRMSMAFVGSCIVAVSVSSSASWLPSIASSANSAPDTIRKTEICYQTRREIHGALEPQALVVPRAHLPQRLRKHRARELADHAGAFRERDELVRHHETESRVLPAHERFDAVDDPAALPPSDSPSAGSRARARRPRCRGQARRRRSRGPASAQRQAWSEDRQAERGFVSLPHIERPRLAPTS